MNKKNKILLIIFVITISLISLLYFSRNFIIISAFEKAVKKKSGNTITLNITGVNFNLFTNNLKIDSLIFLFDSSYLDPKSSMILDKISFSELTLNKLCLKNLFLKNIFEARKLQLKHPSLRLISKEGNKKKVTDPQDFFNILENSSKNNYGILVKLDTLILKYGSININSINNDKKHFSASDLTIIMHDFNTNLNDSTYVYGRMFFSKSLYISGEGIYKYISPGYNLNIDHITWQSDNYHFTLKGLRLVPTVNLPDSLSQLKVDVDSLLLNDFHLLSSGLSSKVKVSKILLNGGFVDVFSKNNKTKKPVQDKKTNYYIFNILNADSLEMDKIRMFIHDEKKDTILFFKKLKVSMNNLKIDSSFFTHPDTYFEYNNLKFYAESLVTKKLVKGYNIHNSTVKYNSKTKTIKFNGLIIKHNDNGFSANINSMKIKLSLKKLFKKQSQQIDIQLIKPEISTDLRLHNLYKELSIKTNKEPILKPKKISITGGYIKLFTTTSDSLFINNINVFSKNFIFEEYETFNYDTLFIKTGEISFYTKDKHYFKTSKFKFLNNNLSLNNLFFTSESESLRQFSSKSLLINKLDLKELIFNKRLYSDAILLKNSKEIIEIKYDSSHTTFNLSKSIQKIENLEGFTLDIGKIHINNNHIILTKGVQKVDFKAEINWNNVKFGKKNNHPITNLNDLKIKIHSAKYLNDNIKLQFDTLSLNSNKGFIDLKNIKVFNNDSSDINRALDIKDISIKSLSIHNINFNTLFSHNKFYFDKLVIENPVFDVISLKNNIKSNSIGNNFLNSNITNSLLYNVLFDSVFVNNLFINYKQKDSITDITYKLHDFSMIYSPIAKRDSIILNTGSLLNNMHFTFDSLKIAENKNGFVFNIESGDLNETSHNFTLKNLFINSGKSKKAKKQIIAKTGTILFENIKTSDSIPILLNIHKLSFENIDMKLLTTDKESAYIETDNSEKIVSLYKLNPTLKSLSIDSILVDNMNFESFGKDSSKRKYSIDNLKLAFSGITLNPKLALDTIPLKIKNFNATIYNRKLISGDSLYEIKAKKLNYKSTDNTLQIDSLYVEPRYDTLDFFVKNKWQTDRINLFIKRISFAGFDFNKWNRNNFLYLNRVDIEEMIGNFYRDKNFPLDTSKTKFLIQDLLSKVNRPFRIDSISIKNSYLKYSELDKKSFIPGHVYFTDANFKAYNITNRPIPNTGETLKISLNMKLMGQGKLEGNFYFPLENQGSQFYFNAKSEKLDLTLLNPMTKNLLGLTIKSGKGTLNIPLITADENIATGYLLFKYRMKIRIYNRRKAEQNKNNGITAPLMNFIINGLVLKNRNPNIFNRPRIGIVYFERDKNKGITNYIWKSTLSGILSTMGFNNKHQRKEKKAYRRKEFDEIRNSIKNIGNKKEKENH